MLKVRAEALGKSRFDVRVKTLTYLHVEVSLEILTLLLFR